MSVPEILQALQSVQASFETHLSVTNSLLQELMNTFDYHFSRLQPQNPNSTPVLPKLNPTFQIATPLSPVIDEESGFLPQSFTSINFTNLHLQSLPPIHKSEPSFLPKSSPPPKFHPPPPTDPPPPIPPPPIEPPPPLDVSPQSVAPPNFPNLNFVVSSSQLAPQLQPQNPLFTMTTKTQFRISHPLSSTPKPPLPSPSEFKEQRKLYHKGDQKRPQLHQCHSRFLRLVGTEDMCDSESTERVPGAVIIFVCGHQIWVREQVMLCGEPPPIISVIWKYGNKLRSVYLLRFACNFGFIDSIPSVGILRDMAMRKIVEA